MRSSAQFGTCRCWRIFFSFLLLLLIASNLVHYQLFIIPLPTVKDLLKYPHASEDRTSEEDPHGREFDEKCKYWKATVLAWKDRLETGKPKYPLQALQVRSGAGDRLSGLVTAMNHAIQRGKKLQVHWQGIDLAFQASALTRHIAGEPLVEIKGDGHSIPALGYKACEDGAFYACDFKIHQADHCPVYNRACMNLKGCNMMKQLYGENMSQAHLFGCPLRLILEPTEGLLDYKISWFVNGRVVNGTVRELEEYLKEYEVLSLHVRVGDQGFNGIAKYQIRPLVQDVRKCIKLVDNFVSESVSSERKVLWFVASDNPTMRAWLRETFPSKVVILMHNPQHLSSVSKIKAKRRARDELLSMFAEWYLLGKGDHLIVNAAHERGRGVSSFARTAWLYTLRSQHYLVRDYDKAFCIKQHFRVEGNINVARGCEVTKTRLRQDHLKPLHSRQKT